MNKYKVFVNEPHLIGNEKKYLLKCLKDGFISSSGPFVKEFENKFAKRVNRKFAISVSNGTAALQLAYEALNLKKKDEVINKLSVKLNDKREEVYKLKNIIKTQHEKDFAAAIGVEVDN